MDDRLLALVDDLKRAEELSTADMQRCARRAAWFGEFSKEQVAELLEEVGRLCPLTAEADKLLGIWLQAAAATRRQAAAPQGVSSGKRGDLANIAQAVYGGLSPASPARGPLLAWLASGDDPSEWEAVAELLSSDPPADEAGVVVALAPFFQSRRKQALRLFPRLLAGLRSPLVAAPVLDLANFLSREKLASEHPAKSRGGELTALLGDLAQSLSSLAEQPASADASAQEVSRRVSQGVALAVSLCDALALMGERGAIGKLYQALEVRHRRLRTEAAAALARLGEEQGRSELVALAAEPTARLRVLAYAKELGLTERIDAQFATPEARAEAELCVWLAEPTQYGVPPTECELVDQRLRQQWPGFAEAVDCFLFRFQYVLTVEGAERSYSNIGIAGPVVHAFVADLGDLPPDEIYAAFAGWQAQHEEIREFDVARLSTSEKLEAERLKRRLHDAGFAHIEPERMGYFFGDKALVAAASREGVRGVAIVDFQQIEFFPPKHNRRPLGATEAYSMYKGRRLLSAFNRDGAGREP